MAPFDGMDPELVRQLLAQVRGAADLMRTTESKITGLLSRAGVSAQVTHRPSQIADSCDQMARDVSAFLAWAAEPKMEQRKQLGFQVLIYMIILTVLLYFTKQKIWSRIKH